MEYGAGCQPVFTQNVCSPPLGDLRLTIFVNTRSHDYFNLLKSKSVSSQNTYFVVKRDKRSHFVYYGECYFCMSYTLFNIPPMWKHSLGAIIIIHAKLQTKTYLEGCEQADKYCDNSIRGNHNNLGQIPTTPYLDASFHLRHAL